MDAKQRQKRKEAKQKRRTKRKADDARKAEVAAAARAGERMKPGIAIAPATAARASTRGQPVRIAPYSAARWFEESEQLAELQRTDPQHAARFWTMGRLANLETDAIVARLGALGTDLDQAGFKALATGQHSAWDLAEPWKARLPQPHDRFDVDFLGLAACELWRRWLPARPSMEMLDDWMQEGYALEAAGQVGPALDLWLRVWEALAPRFQPRMSTCDATEGVFLGRQGLYNWVQDVVEGALNAGRHDAGAAERGARFCTEVLRQFGGEDELFKLNFRADRGDLLYMAGQEQAGEQELRDLIRDFPDRAVGYVHLAERLAGTTCAADRPQNYAEAVRVLEAAVARPVVDAADYDLAVWLEAWRRSADKAAEELT